jgi:RHS repeat-associated protein
VPDLPASGTYQVYAKWTADETRATDARYTILHEGGTAQVSVNQRAAGGLWQYLGSYAFDPLNTPTVSLAANDNGSVAADAVRFVGGPGGATDIAYLHADHLGTPQAMTDANAQVLWWRDQTPFGQTVAEGGFSVNPLRFPGQYADVESGLAYNYFRDYDPALGRYIQSDPIGLGGGLNTYGYVGGNPVSYVDPTGMQSSPPPGVPYPHEDIPGGPWTWSPNPQNSRGGEFVGSKQPRGPRTTCTYAPPGPNNPEPYWKIVSPGGQKQRYNMEGEEITADEAHPGPGTGPQTPRIPKIGPLLPWFEWQNEYLKQYAPPTGAPLEAQSPQGECDVCGNSG